MSDDINQAKELLAAEGYVVLRAKSHANALERARTDRVLREAAERDAENARAWARKAYDEWRQLYGRCSYLYGLAVACGATEDELRGGMETATPTTAA